MIADNRAKLAWFAVVFGITVSVIVALFVVYKNAKIYSDQQSTGKILQSICLLALERGGDIKSRRDLDVIIAENGILEACERQLGKNFHRAKFYFPWKMESGHFVRVDSREILCEVIKENWPSKICIGINLSISEAGSQ